MAEITLLCPVYNAEAYLRECIDSIINQTFTDWYFIACDDGSNDESKKILYEYAVADSRILVLENTENKGIVYTRNRLLEATPSSTRFVAWIDADDVCLAYRLEKQISYLKDHPEIAAVGSNLEIINEKSQVTGFRYYPCSPDKIRKMLPKCNILAQPSMMLRHNVIIETGKISSKYKVCEDYEYWLRILEKYDFANLTAPVIQYRISTEQSKQRYLKPTLLNTVKIQKDYFARINQSIPFDIRLRHCAFLLLRFFPSKLILAIFCFLNYKKNKSAK